VGYQPARYRSLVCDRVLAGIVRAAQLLQSHRQRTHYSRPETFPVFPTFPEAGPWQRRPGNGGKDIPVNDLLSSNAKTTTSGAAIAR
jgi:hypothetical protein